ncbi:hypothetical protein Tco_0249418, partial [Tanacetum coccineum]
KAQIKKLKKKANPVITHHRAWMKSVSLKQRLAGKKSLKKKWMQKESVSKQGRKSAKAEPTVLKDKAFDKLDDEIDNMETKDAQEMGGQDMWCMKRSKGRKMKLVLKMHLVPTKKKIVPTDQMKVLASKKLVPTRKKIVLIDQMKVLLTKLKEEALLQHLLLQLLEMMKLLLKFFST